MSTAAQVTLAAPKSPIADLDTLWQAVLERHPQLDGVFYYGVRSTGVFCRPSCPSRRPRRENVEFFLDPARARAAGLRACRRCKPETASPRDAAAAEVKRLCQYIEENLEGTLTLQTLAAALGASPFHVHRIFKRAMGVTPQDYIAARRHSVFRTALRMGQSVADATYTAGFNSSRGVYESAHAHLGMTPAAYRKGAPQQKIAFAVAESPLGKLLVAQTEKGVCRIALADSDAELRSLLYAEYPKALIAEDDAALRASVEAIVGYLTAERQAIDLPVDLRATSFQLRVWRELQKVPFGKTLSYEQLAQRIRQPKAVRAVARACATNPVALVVPCHRIVRKDGNLGGYRWGEKRKQQLLELERQKN